MRNAFRFDVAKFLARKALDGKTISYSDLTEEFGGIDRGWGNTLGGIALRCRDAGLPLLSVIVVNKGTNLPSVDAVLYQDLGLKDQLGIAAEQVKCFQYDWNSSKLQS